MADWKQTDNSLEKDLHYIGALFESGKIKRMYDISELFPTKIVKLLGINSERYAVKLAEPEKFSLSEILRMAYLFGVDPNLIVDVVQKETEKKIVGKIDEQKKKFKLG